MKKHNKSYFRNRIKFSVYSAIMMTGLIIVLLLLNYFVTTLDNRFNLTLDMTSRRLYSLTGTTQEVLNTLEQDVYIYTTETAGIEDRNVKEILKKYSASSDKIHVDNIDVVKNPAAIKYYNEFLDYSVTAGSIIVTDTSDTSVSGQRYKILNYDDMYGYNTESETYDIFNAENSITRAIKYVDNPKNQKIWILDNHNQSGAQNSAYVKVLEDENYDINFLNILNGQNPLQDGDIVIALSMDSDLTDVERNILIDFLDNGGKMILGILPSANVQNDFKNIISLYGMYNIKIGNGKVFETNLENIAVTSDNEYMYSFILPKFKEHKITNDFILGDYKLLLGMNVGQIVLPKKINNPSITIEPLLVTSESSFLEPWIENMDDKPNDDANYGEFAIMAAVTENIGDDEAKVILMSAPEVFTYSDAFLQNVYKNKTFLLKTISWLSDEDTDIIISGRSLSDSTMMIKTMKQAYTIVGLVCVVIPLIIFGAGIFIFIRRNNL